MKVVILSVWPLEEVARTVTAGDNVQVVLVNFKRMYFTLAHGAHIGVNLDPMPGMVF